MPGPFLTTSSTILCSHGGKAILNTANIKTSAGKTPVLLVTDVHAVAGCPFTLPGPKYSPCVRIQWSAGAAMVKVNGTPVLLQSSVGIGYNAEGAPQGPAQIVTTQTKTSGK